MSETKPYNLKLKEFVFLIFQSNPLELQSIQNFCQRSERERKKQENKERREERKKDTKKDEKRESEKERSKY
jgi:hypothetical protein